MDIFVVRDKTGEFYLFFGQYPSRDPVTGCWKTKNLLECVRLRECSVPEWLEGMTWKDLPRRLELFDPGWKKILHITEYEYLMSKKKEANTLLKIVNDFKEALGWYNSLPWWKKIFVKKIEV